MIIRLTPQQISTRDLQGTYTYWEIIKYGMANTHIKDEKDIHYYNIQTLYELLSGKAQCYFMLDKETRAIKALMINRILSNKITGDLILYGEYLYAFEKSNIDVYKKLVETSLAFAKNNNCKAFEFDSANSKIWDMASNFNIAETFRNYIIKL